MPEVVFKNTSFEKFLISLISNEKLPPLWIIEVLKRDIEKGQVKLLLDAWDEVKDNQQEQVNQFIASIPDNISYDISTRPYAEPSLNLRRSPDYHLSLEKFTDDQIKEYIKKFFEISGGNNEKADEIFNWLKKHFISEVTSLIGIPLHLYLLCEGVLRELIKENKLNDQNDKLTEIELYQRFTSTKLYLFLTKHMKMEEKSTLIKSHRTYTFCAPYTDFLMIKSYQQLFDKKIDFVSHHQRSIYYTSEIISELPDTGLVSRVKLQDYEFIHQTYAEYFAALFILKSLLTDENSILYKEIIKDIANNRYFEKYRVIFVFAAQLSVNGDDLIPGWKANKETFVEKFWEALCQPPKDLIGRAMSRLLSDCLRGLNEQQQENLKKLLSEDLCKTIFSYKNDEKRYKNKQNQSDKTIMFSYGINTNEFYSEINDNFCDLTLEDKAQLENKSAVFSYTRDLIEKNKSSLPALVLYFDKIVTGEIIVDFYWYVDGGFRAIALLGDYFSENFFDLFIEKIVFDTYWNVPYVSDAVEILLEYASKKEVFKYAIIILLFVYHYRNVSLRRKINFSNFIDRILQVISSDILLKEIVYIFNNILLNDIYKIASPSISWDEGITDILSLVFLIAYKMNYAVTFDKDSCELSISIKNNNTIIAFENKDKKLIFKKFIQDFFENYNKEKEEGKEKFLIEYNRNLNIFSKEWAELLAVEIKKYLEKKDGYWSLRYGITAVGKVGLFFNGEFAHFLILRAGFGHQKEAKESLEKIYSSLIEIIENKNNLKTGEVSLAINAYNECIQHKLFQNLNLKKIEISEKYDEKSLNILNTEKNYQLGFVSNISNSNTAIKRKKNDDDNNIENENINKDQPVNKKQKKN